MYHQNKEYQRWSCKKEKKDRFISSAYDEYKFELSGSVDISSELDFEKYLEFDFLEGFEKRFEEI